MSGVAWYACAALALCSLGAARTFGRCELARELRSLGVYEDLSTWVCIAFHESRLDTAAYNPNSKDHGLLQISELFWCGAGKACGLPCSALRDDDIADDVRCALQVHEEHTRLQGDGFLAWVVYLQHCKHNTKKYLVDCDAQLSDIQFKEKPILRYGFNSIQNPNIDDLKPPYLAVKSIVRAEFGNELYRNRQRSGRTNWYDYKIDNIDELKLPVFRRPGAAAAPAPGTGARAPASRKPTTASPITTTKKVDIIREQNIITDTYVPRVIRPVLAKSTPTTLVLTQTTTEQTRTTSTNTTLNEGRSAVSLKSVPTLATTLLPPVTSSSTTQADMTTKFTFSTTTPLPAYANKIYPQIATTARPETKFFTSQPFVSSSINSEVEPRRFSQNQESTTKAIAESTTIRTTFSLRPFFTNKTFVETTTTKPTTSFFPKRPPFPSNTGIEYKRVSFPDRPETTTGKTRYSSESKNPSTESVFDFYLNTRRPTLSTYSFAPLTGQHVRLSLFGTTPLPPRAPARLGLARNQVRRQAAEPH